MNPSRTWPAELDWPFFSDAHRAFKLSLDTWCAQHLNDLTHEEDRTAVDRQCLQLVEHLGSGGWLRHAVAGKAHGGAQEQLDTRELCLLRETLAWHHGLADFAFAMQGLGSGALSLFGTESQKSRYLPLVAEGKAVAAFALSEPLAGSDVDRKSTRLNSSHSQQSRMPSSA